MVAKIYCKVPQKHQEQNNSPAGLAKAGAEIWALVMLDLQSLCFVRYAVTQGGGGALLMPAGFTSWDFHRVANCGAGPVPSPQLGAFTVESRTVKSAHILVTQLLWHFPLPSLRVRPSFLAACDIIITHCLLTCM